MSTGHIFIHYFDNIFDWNLGKEGNYFRTSSMKRNLFGNKQHKEVTYLC